MNLAKTHSTTISNESISVKLKKFTTLAVCLSPILFIYRFLGYFMLGEIVLLALLLINLAFSSSTSRKISKKQIIIFLFAVAIYIISCFGYIINSLDVSVLPRLIRLIFCLFMVAVLGEYFFDYKSAKKYILAIALIAATLIVFQKVYHEITGDFIYFVFKKNIYSHVYNQNYFLNVESLSVYRPMGIFLEPSHHCQYALFALVIALSYDKLENGTFIAALISAGIVVSTSSTGVILCILIWVIHFIALLQRFIYNKSIDTKAIISICLIAVFAIVIMFIFGDQFVYSIERIYDVNESSPSAAWDGRLETYSVFAEYESLGEILFGRGYGMINEEEWYASIPYYYSGTGILGLSVVIAFFALLFVNSKSTQKKIIGVFAFLCVTTEVLTNYWLIFILALVMTADEEIDNQLLV